MKRVATWALAATLAAAASCSDAGPVAGVLTLSLTTPNAGADGAILFSVTGPQPLASVTAGPGLRVFLQPSSTVTRCAVTGPLTNGTVVTIGVADVRQVAQYVATIQGVAASADFQLRALTGYSLTVSK